MTLSEWIKEKDLRISDVSRMLGVPQPTVYTWVKGVWVGDERHFPVPELANLKKIDKMTKGKVSYNDWD